MKEIRFKLRKVNNIPNNYTAVPSGIVLPFDLFGDGECERTQRKDVTLRTREKSGPKVKPLQMADGGWIYGTQCPNADGSYGEISWNRSERFKTQKEAEAAGNALIQ